jgi:hypothetical protein
MDKNEVSQKRYSTMNSLAEQASSRRGPDLPFCLVDAALLLVLIKIATR